jgi:hypothetical protein
MKKSRMYQYNHIKCIFFLFFCGSIISIGIGGEIVGEWLYTRQFKNAVATGKDAHFMPKTGGLCAWGTIKTYLVDKNNTKTKQITLYYPAVNKWIVCMDSSDVETWATGITSSSKINVLVEDNSIEKVRGITVIFENIAGYIILLIIGIIFFIFIVIIIIWILWELIKNCFKNCCCRY